MTPFEKKVLTVVSRIPPGRVATYGDVARLAGKPRAARAVGNILREADRPGLPYHRVIAAGGRLGGYYVPCPEAVFARRGGTNVAQRGSWGSRASVGTASEVPGCLRCLGCQGRVPRCQGG